MDNTTKIVCKAVLEADRFNQPREAMQDTEWIQKPADPTKHTGGLIRKGDMVWFDSDLFGSGPEWQQVRLTDKTLGYVNPHHFASIVSESETG